MKTLLIQALKGTGYDNSQLIRSFYRTDGTLKSLFRCIEHIYGELPSDLEFLRDL